MHDPDGAPFWKRLAHELRAFPAGRQSPWGIPFDLPSRRTRRRVIMARAAEETSVALELKADYLCLLHTFRKADTDPSVYREADGVAEYELHYADGTSHVHRVRARFDVPIPESPGPVQLARPFCMPTATDPEAAPFIARVSETDALPGRRNWGWLQTGVLTGAEEPLLFAVRNPRPAKTVRALTIRGLTPSPLLVAGLTAYRGTAHPLRHLARRRYRVRGRKGPVQVQSLEVDMGAVARVDRTLGPRDRRWLQSPFTGVTNAPEPPRKSESVFAIHGAADATVSALIDGRRRPARFSLGEAATTGKSSDGGLTLERLGGARQWM
jgi:hypothetical protein